MSKRIPEVTHSGRLTIDRLDIEVLTLDNGKRVIPHDDMVKVLEFLGLHEDEINTILNLKGGAR